MGYWRRGVAMPSRPHRPGRHIDPHRSPAAGSGRARTRHAAAARLLALLAVRCRVVLGLAVGEPDHPAGTVVDVLFHPDGSDASRSSTTCGCHAAVLAVAVGVALGVAGALI